MLYSDRLASYLESLVAQGCEVGITSEFSFEALADFSTQGTIDEVLSWYQGHVANTAMSTERIPLSECREWTLGADGAIAHSSGEFFRIEGYRVTGTSSREVTTGWDQPFLTQVGYVGGILGLLRKRIDGVPHYLVEAKAEPGNYQTVQISPTVQATNSNLRQAHRGGATSYRELFVNPEEHPVRVLFDQWTSEDGGRLFNKRNRSMMVEHIGDDDIEITSDRFKWVSWYQLKTLVRDQDAIIAPHIRGILAAF